MLLGHSGLRTRLLNPRRAKETGALFFLRRPVIFGRMGRRGKKSESLRRARSWCIAPALPRPASPTSPRRPGCRRPVLQSLRQQGRVRQWVPDRYFEGLCARRWSRPLCDRRAGADPDLQLLPAPQGLCRRGELLPGLSIGKYQPRVLARATPRRQLEALIREWTASLARCIADGQHDGEHSPRPSGGGRWVVPLLDAWQGALLQGEGRAINRRRSTISSMSRCPASAPDS